MRTSVLSFSAAVMATVLCVRSVSADEDTGPVLPSVPDDNSLSIVGADISARNRIAVVTEIYAPFGRAFDAPGLRFRIQTGGGAYGGDPSWSQKYFGEAMIGYAAWRGNVGATVYGGWVGNYHETSPGEVQNGFEDGPAALAEVWWRPQESTTLSGWGRYEAPYDARSVGLMAEQSLAGNWSALVAGRGGEDQSGSYWAAEAGFGYTFHAPFMLMGPDRKQTARLFAGISGDETDEQLSVRFELLLWNTRPAP